MNLSILLWTLTNWIRGYKHEWICPVCKSFWASSSSKEAIERVKVLHTENHVNRSDIKVEF